MSRAAPELAHLFRALKAPAAARALPALAERARAEEWSYERFAEALLSTEVSSRDSHGGEGRIKAARFPARKTLEEFDFTFQRSVKKTVVEHLGQLDFLHARENVILLGPPGTGKTHLAVALSIRACLAGQRTLFATATQWVARLSDAKRQGSLEAELRRLSFIPLLVVDEVGYIPFDPEAANLMFSLVSSRYERASMIVTDKPLAAIALAERRRWDVGARSSIDGVRALAAATPSASRASKLLAPWEGRRCPRLGELPVAAVGLSVASAHSTACW